MFATVALGACVAQPAPVQTGQRSIGGESPLVGSFVRVGAETGVPPELLAAVSWIETGFSFAQAAQNREGAVGLMGLTDGGSRDLATGAMLAGVTDQAARTDNEASIRAGAALLQAPGARSIHDFTPSLRAFGGDGLALAVEQALALGIAGHDDAGWSITVAAQPDLDQVTPDHTRGAGGCNTAQGSGCGGPACAMLALGATLRRRRRAG